MALLGVAGIRLRTAEGAIVDQRLATASIYALELEGQMTDTLKTAEGGFPRSEVITDLSGSTPFANKHIGPPRYQDVTVQCTLPASKPLSDWINATLAMNQMRKSGAIITANFERKEQSRLQFNNALITEIGFPASDGSSKEAAFLTVKLAPEHTTPLAGTGAVIGLPATKTQKAFIPSNFRLTINGIDCSKVNKIESFTIKQSTQTDPAGTRRDFAKVPGKLEFPNLVVNVPEAFAGSFYAWFQDMVINGNAGENNERIGTLEWLDPTLKNTVLTVTFHHLGIFGFTPETGGDGIRRVKVEMYCEQITLAPGK
jgi:hypothetical protein